LDDRLSAILVALATRAGVLLRGAAARTAAVAVFFLVLFTTAAAVGSAAALAGDFALLFGVHGREAATAAAAAVVAAFLFPAPAPAAAGSPAAFAPGLAGFFLVPLVGAAAFVRGAAALAGDLALFLGVHCREAAAAVTVGGLTVALGHAAVALAFFAVAGLVMAVGLAVVMGRGLVVEGGVAVVGRLAALAANLGHMLPVAADRLAPLAAGLGRLFRIKLVGRPALVRRTTALDGDLALLLGVHGGEAARVVPGHVHPPSGERREKYEPAAGR